MRDKAAGDAWVEHNRTAAGRHLLGPEAFDRTLAGALADFGRVAQIGGKNRARKIIVALHAVARPADHTGADAVARTRIGADKAVRCGECYARSAPAGFRTLGIGNARDRECRFFGGARPL